jgi:MFS family permease
MAMFVLVVDTSLMNVSISAVVDDIGTTVSGVQSAIALEALVSAAFILIGGKVGDLVGRKRAYVLGLLGYAVGAVAMTLAQGLVAIIVFWAVIGGLGASLLLPSMQSLVHGNFEGEARKKVYALVGAAAAIAAAVGPPIFLQMVLEYDAMRAGLSLAPLSLTMFAVALLAGRKAGGRRPSRIIRVGFATVSLGLVALLPVVPRADSGWDLLIPLAVVGSGLGLLVSQLNNYTLAPISDERVSEAAGVNSAAGSFGLSFGLAFAGAILLATLSIAFTSMAEDSSVLAPDEQQQVADALEDDAEVLSNTQLAELLVGQPEDVQDEILRINTDARPLALQVALAVPILAALLGLANSFRMVRIPEPAPAASSEERMALG